MRLSTVLLVSGLFAVCTITSAAEPPQVDREMQLRTTLRYQVDTAWRADDFKALEKMGEDFVQHRSKTFNGMPKLAPYFYDVEQQLYIEWPYEWNIPAHGKDDCRCSGADPAHYQEGDRRWSVVEQKLAAWSKRYPDSTIAPVARIKYLLHRAWFYRGGAMSDQVHHEAWPRFQEYIAEADKLVRTSASIRFKNPVWYGDAAQVAAAQDWPVEERSSMAAEMIEHGQMYTPSFENAAIYMQPKWGGSYEVIDDFIRRSVQHSPKEDRLEFYARLYWVLSESADEDLRTHSLAEVNRSMLNQGFNIVLDRYPESWNFIGAARLACRAGDDELFQRATRWLGDYDRYKGKALASIDCKNADFSPAKLVATH